MKRVFTLIEILVVLAVIGILAVLMFPTFERARNSARRSSCQSNLKQITLAFNIYMRDFDESWPLNYTNDDGIDGYNPASDRGWPEAIQPYIKNYRLFNCPSEPTPLQFPPFNSDYWMSTIVSGLKLSKLGYPERIVFLGDGIQGPAANLVTHGAIAYSGDAPTYKYNGEIWDVTGKTEGKGGRRHKEGLNIAFMDGHVKWCKPEDIAAAPLSDGVPTFRIK
jgi:prepilin-type processing-associated H-X9-DG protein/prepilin-type N-terminal cleavage/methylation domain-containing protein